MNRLTGVVVVRKPSLMAWSIVVDGVKFRVESTREGKHRVHAVDGSVVGEFWEDDFGSTITEPSNPDDTAQNALVENIAHQYAKRRG